MFTDLEFHDVKRSFVKESKGQLLRKLNKWPIRICPSLQSWKIRIINQPQKGSSKEQAAQKRAFDSINQTFLILIPWSHHHHHRGKHKKNKTFHSPVWRCQTYKSSICAFARATHHLGDVEEMKIHHRHQQASISNSIFKLNIVRFMHTKEAKRNLFCHHPSRSGRESESFAHFRRNSNI